MATKCNMCKMRNDCESIRRSPDCYHTLCEDFILDDKIPESYPKKYVLIHRYEETGHISIVAFDDSRWDLLEVMHSQPHYGSKRHSFFIFPNPTGDFGLQPSVHPLFEGLIFNDVKDKCLLNVCKNVAEFLAVAEYSMLKKSYYKSSVWFEKAKNSAILGAEILYNY